MILTTRNCSRPVNENKRKIKRIVSIASDLKTGERNVICKGVGKPMIHVFSDGSTWLSSIGTEIELFQVRCVQEVIRSPPKNACLHLERLCSSRNGANNELMVTLTLDNLLPRFTNIYDWNTSLMPLGGSRNFRLCILYISYTKTKYWKSRLVHVVIQQ